MIEPTRVYLRTASSTFSRLMWFRNNAKNEMLIGFYGLSEKQATLDYIFPERRVSEEDLRSLRFNYSDLRKVNEIVDHITYHQDGSFHIKTKDRKPVYRDTFKWQEPLGANTPTFLDFIIISDLAANYCVISTIPKYPHICLSCNENKVCIIEGKFSGANYQLEKEMADRILGHVNPAGCIMLKGHAIKGILWPRTILIKQENLANRPKGTTILFKFPLTNQSCLIKGFIFS